MEAVAIGFGAAVVEAQIAELVVANRGRHPETAAERLIDAAAQLHAAGLLEGQVAAIAVALDAVRSDLAPDASAVRAGRDLLAAEQLLAEFARAHELRKRRRHEGFRVELVEDIGVNAFLARGQVAEQRHQPPDPRCAAGEQCRVHVMAERLFVRVQEILAEVAVEREQDAADSGQHLIVERDRVRHFQTVVDPDAAGREQMAPGWRSRARSA